MHEHGVSHEYHFVYYLGSRLKNSVVTYLYDYTIFDYYPIHNLLCVLRLLVGAMWGWRGRFQCDPDGPTCATEEREEDWNYEDAHAMARHQNTDMLCLIFHCGR